MWMQLQCRQYGIMHAAVAQHATTSTHAHARPHTRTADITQPLTQSPTWRRMRPCPHAARPCSGLAQPPTGLPWHHTPWGEGRGEGQGRGVGVEGQVSVQVSRQRLQACPLGILQLRSRVCLPLPKAPQVKTVPTYTRPRHSLTPTVQSLYPTDCTH
jgi:hypothetical protein